MPSTPKAKRLNKLVILSPSDQVADHLRGLIRSGCWKTELPGTPILSRALGVDRKTVIMAIKTLEEEGLLKFQGLGRPRLINSKSAAVSRS